MASRMHPTPIFTWKYVIFFKVCADPPIRGMFGLRATELRLQEAQFCFSLMHKPRTGLSRVEQRPDLGLCVRLKRLVLVDPASGDPARFTSVVDGLKSDSHTIPQFLRRPVDKKQPREPQGRRAAFGRAGCTRTVPARPAFSA